MRRKPNCPLRSRHLFPAIPRRQHGQDLVEFALVLPLILALTFGIIDFGRVFFSYNTVANAAREAARYGVIHPADDAGIRTAARRLTAGLYCDGDPGGAPEVTPTHSAITVTVGVSCHLHLMTGIIIRAVGGDPNIPLYAEATMRVE